MVFWVAVLVGGLFAWVAVQIGFYATWTLFFNLVLSVYVALFLTPLVVNQIPEAAATPYGYALTLVSIAVATLSIAYGICIACLSGRLRAEFPHLFDNVAAGLLGFLSGFLVWSFLSFAICLTPLSQVGFAKTLGVNSQSQRLQIAYLCGWCDLLHFVVSSSDSPMTTEQAVAVLLENTGAAGSEESEPDELPDAVAPEESSEPTPETTAQPDNDRTSAEATPHDEDAQGQSPPASEPTGSPHSSPPPGDGE